MPADAATRARARTPDSVHATARVPASGLATYGALGFGFASAALFLAQLRRPDHDPTAHFISELALGETGPLFAASFWVLAPSIVALAIAFHVTLPATRDRRRGVALLGLAAFGCALLPFFPMSPPQGYTTPETVVHGTIATAAFLAFNIGIITLTRALVVEPRWRRHRTLLNGLAFVGTSLLAVFIGMVAMAELEKGHPATPFLGLVERVVLGIHVAWCFVATATLSSIPGGIGVPATPVPVATPYVHATDGGHGTRATSGRRSSSSGLPAAVAVSIAASLGNEHGTQGHNHADAPRPPQG